MNFEPWPSIFPVDIHFHICYTVLGGKAVTRQRRISSLPLQASIMPPGKQLVSNITLVDYLYIIQVFLKVIGQVFSTQHISGNVHQDDAHQHDRQPTYKQPA